MTEVDRVALMERKENLRRLRYHVEGIEKTMPVYDEFPPLAKEVLKDYERLLKEEERSHGERLSTDGDRKTPS